MSRQRGVARPDQGDRKLSHDVRVWKIRTMEGKKRKTYGVRWKVGGREHHDTFATYTLADAFRAKLIGYQQKGTAFDIATGLPEPMLKEQAERTWYQHVAQYVDMKWPNAAPKSRKSIAETLATATAALVKDDRAAPPAADLRAAVYGWVTRPAERAAGLPEHLAPAVRWLERNTVALSALEDRTSGPALVRATLDVLARTVKGEPAAANTISRRRAVLYNVFEYAVELGVLTANPIDFIAWKIPKSAETVDRRVVVNAEQAERLLEAVARQGDIGQRLVAFYACMYYAALRPAEAIGLTRANLADLPKSGWGELLLARSTPRSGTAWSNNGRGREERGLKHRAADDTRPVPAHPRLVTHLNNHVERFDPGQGGRLFVGPLGGLLDESRYLHVWRVARRNALSPAEVASPLAKRPYDLRHAAVSTWLNAGVPPTQVAEWAGHSVAVLLRVYAKCIVGQDKEARKRIERATRSEQGSFSEPTADSQPG
ncbi:integrase [Catellatospora sp. NPDC049609]|uniref:tyrosine-type recombinase/integrase n=1 Tax=Catellatospora sp. NPDC049609 TaxID=3155505 RepID=UPI003431B366